MTSEGEVPPHLLGPYRRIIEAGENLETILHQAQAIRHGDWDSRTEVDDEFMEFLAASSLASDELRAYAARVAGGECRWAEIETLASPRPPELADLRDDTEFIWTFPEVAPTTPEPKPEVHWEDEEPYQFKWE